jgi:hypothetical protein
VEILRRAGGIGRGLGIQTGEFTRGWAGEFTRGSQGNLLAGRRGIYSRVAGEFTRGSQGIGRRQQRARRGTSPGPAGE